mmetsp:Transcript_39016/g.65575  ORF Transcript_39016/g.65575 Transcript_39016/m.65575 type:complete len:232 (-) Transcript_39016:330-1025(-)
MQRLTRDLSRRLASTSDTADFEQHRRQQSAHLAATPGSSNTSDKGMFRSGSIQSFVETTEIQLGRRSRMSEATSRRSITASLHEASMASFQSGSDDRFQAGGVLSEWATRDEVSVSYFLSRSLRRRSHSATATCGPSGCTDKSHCLSILASDSLARDDSQHSQESQAYTVQGHIEKKSRRLSDADAAASVLVSNALEKKSRRCTLARFFWSQGWLAATHFSVLQRYPILPL